MPNLNQKLESLGLHKNEITIYLALFELGQSRAANIIEHTKLHRNLVYTALEELTRKKLVTKMEKGKVYVFEANDPSVIKENLAEKMETAESAIDELRALLVGKTRDVRVYEGVEGVEVVRNKVAREILQGEPYYIMGASYSNTNEKLENYFPKLNQKILKRGGNIKVLVAGDEDPKIITSRGLTWKKHTRYLPFNIKSPMWMTLFRDTLNISVASNEPVTFSIRSAEAADGFKKYFEYFWNQPTKIEYGISALKRVFYDMLDEMSAGEEYYVFGTAIDNDKNILQFYDEYHRNRIKKGVVVKMLAYQKDFQNIQKRFADCGDKAGKLSFIKSFFTISEIPMQITLYKNQTRLIFLSTNPMVIYLNQPEIYSGFKNYFDSIWAQN